MSRSSTSSTIASVSQALQSHAERYGKDLAYLLKRLDKTEELINCQQTLISYLTIKVADLQGSHRQAPDPEPVTDSPVIHRGHCRIHQFSARN